ncbi:MAG: PIN domain-containing protein [Treponema sp.]|nr:PIN domain-containing protein [Treponema sp.]
MTYFLDTNIVSYVIKGNDKVRSHIVKLLSAGNEVKIPVVAYYEIKRGLLATCSTAKLQLFLNFAQKLGIVNTTIETYDIASQIYADLRISGKNIEDADIFIGASTLEYGAILITNNVEHLSRIKNIQIEPCG